MRRLLVILLPSAAFDQGRCLNGNHKPNLKELCVSCAGGGYSHTLPIRVCAAQRGRDFEAPGLERGIHFRGVF